MFLPLINRRPDWVRPMWRVLYWNPWGQFYRSPPGLEVGGKYRDNNGILVLGVACPRSVHRQTAVDVQRFARDVAAEIGRQKCHGRRDIGAAAEARERYLIAQ